MGSGTKGTHPEDRLPRPAAAPDPPGGQLSSRSPEGSSIDDRPAAPPPMAPADVEPLFDEFESIYTFQPSDIKLRNQTEQKQKWDLVRRSHHFHNNGTPKIESTSHFPYLPFFESVNFVLRST